MTRLELLSASNAFSHAESLSLWTQLFAQAGLVFPSVIKCWLLPVDASRGLYNVWLVVWNIFYFPIYWVANHPNWLVFFRGVAQPPTRCCTISIGNYDHHIHCGDDWAVFNGTGTCRNVWALLRWWPWLLMLKSSHIPFELMLSYFLPQFITFVHYFAYRRSCSIVVESQDPAQLQTDLQRFRAGASQRNVRRVAAYFLVWPDRLVGGRGRVKFVKLKAGDDQHVHPVMWAVGPKPRLVDDYRDSGWWFGCHFLFSHILGC